MFHTVQHSDVTFQPCAENLYLTLMKEYHSYASPVVMEMLQEHQFPCNPTDLAVVLQKDAGQLAVLLSVSLNTGRLNNVL